MILCAWCGVRPVTNPRKNRFCSRSCSATWRMTQPEIRAKVYNPETAAKISAAQIRASGTTDLNERRAARMRARNPMREPETRAKVSATLKAIGHKPRDRGGNGKPLSEAHSALLTALNLYHGDFWIPDFSVATGWGGGHHYLIDCARPDWMIAIEVDGGSHATLARQESDRQKDAFLRSQGWSVFRRSNAEAIELARYLISKCQAPTPTS